MYRIYPYFILTLFALFLFSACNLLGGKDHKTTIPGKIVFSMPDDSEIKNYQIYVMNADGSDITQLTSFENQESFDPSWSPDGEQIVFTSTMRSTSLGPAIHIMDANGENIRPMKLWPDSLHAYAGSNPVWSPDGTKIAFDWCVDCEMFGENYEIFIYDIAKDSVTQITDHHAGDTYPTWSPDGSKIAFSSKRDYYDSDTLRYRSDLYSINTDVSNLQRLTKTGNATIPRWHPENSIIAYEWNILGNNVFLIDLESEEIFDVDSDLEFEASPQWSKRGKHLILLGRKHEGIPSEIQFFNFEKNTLLFVKRIDNNPFLLKAGSLDWYYNENK